LFLVSYKLLFLFLSPEKDFRKQKTSFVSNDAKLFLYNVDCRATYAYCQACLRNNEHAANELATKLNNEVVNFTCDTQLLVQPQQTRVLRVH